MQFAILGEADESFGGLRSCAKHFELQCVPVDLTRTLSQVRVRDGCPVPDEHNHGYHPGLHVVPSGTLVDLIILIVDPRSWGQVDIAVRRLLHQWSDEEVGSEEILVLDEPGCGVFWVLQEQGTYHRVALSRGEGCLGVDVGHQPVPELYDASKGFCEPFAVLPRFGGRCAMAAAV